MCPRVLNVRCELSSSDVGPPPPFLCGSGPGEQLCCKGDGGREDRGGGCGWEARSSSHCTDISENLPGLPQCEAALGVLYQELERTWPVAGSRENGGRGEIMVPGFFPSTEGQFLMMGAEVRNAKL